MTIQVVSQVPGPDREPRVYPHHVQRHKGGRQLGVRYGRVLEELKARPAYKRHIPVGNPRIAGLCRAVVCLDPDSGATVAT